MDDDNCPYEASERVRREARLSLTACGGYVETESDDVPDEGPEAPAPTETVTNERTSIHDTIELVSYAESVATQDADDIVLARVNGEQIFESQVAPLVKLELKRQGIDEGSAEHQKLYRPELRRQLARVIDSTRLRQSARQGLRLQQAPTKEQVATWLDRQIDFNQHVDDAEIAAVYTRDIHKYNTTAKVRWERISVPLFNFDNREQAHMVVSFLMNRASGTQVNTPPGFNPQAIENQTHPWSTRKQIASRRIAEMLFKLPVGQLSPIIEDQRAFHLVRVLERVAPRVTSQEDVAGEIRQQILQQRREAAGKQLLASLVQRSDIWTAFQTAPSNTATSSPDALSQGAPSHESKQPEIANQLTAQPTATTSAATTAATTPSQSTLSQSTPGQATPGQTAPQQSTLVSTASGMTKPVAATQQVATQDINRDPPSFPSLPQLPSQSTAGRVDSNVARTSATIPIDSHPGITLEDIAIRPQSGDGSRTSPRKLRRLPPP